MLHNRLLEGYYLKIVTHAFLALLFFFTLSTPYVSAAITHEEVQPILSEMNWTIEELQEYLAYYELTLADFETLEDLQAMLGTPITEENLNELLQNYGLTHQELEALLGEFGESLDDYHFIEDLDVAVDFYLNHDEEMADVEEILAQIGLTDEEVDRLFTHLMSLDELTLEEEMERIMAKLEPFMEIEDPAQLTDEQQQVLLNTWEELLAAYHLKANFYLTDGTATPISYTELLKLETLNGKKLLIELYDLEGNMLLDMQVSEDMLGSDAIVDTGEDLVDVGDMAGELTKELHNGKLPNTASPFALNIMIGLLLIVSGFIFYCFSRKQARA